MSNSPTSDDALPSRPWLPWGGGAVLAAVMGLSLWYAWSYWYAAPTLPEIDLTTASPELVKVVKEAVADVRARPRSADAWGRLGMIMLGHGYYSEARVCFTEAARLDPQSARWLYLHARTSFRYQPRQAIALLERALVVDPDDAVCRLLLGELFLEEGRLDDAERVLVALLQDESMKPWGHLRLAQLSLRRGDVPRALEQAQRAQQRLEDSKAVHVLLSEIHFRLGDAKQAEAAQQTAQALRDRRAPDPHMEVVDRLRVDVLPLLAQAKDDIAALEDVVRAHPQSIPARFSLAQALLRKQHWQPAAAAATEVLKLNPKEAVALSVLGQALRRQGRVKDAVDAFQRSLAVNSHNPETHYELAHCYYLLEQRPAVKEALKTAVQLRPNYADAWRELGQCFAKEDDAQALICLRRAVELAPGDVVARKLLDGVQARLDKAGGPRPK